MKTAKTTEMRAGEPTSSFSVSTALRHILMLVFINVLLPLIIYRMVAHFWKVSDLVALTIAALPPLLNTVMTLLYKRRIDLLGIWVLAGFAFGIIMMLITGDARYLFLRESVMHGVFGIACLVSLIQAKPMGLTVYSYLRTGGTFARDLLLERQWQDETVRFTFRMVTLVVGIALIILMFVHVLLAFFLSISQFLSIGPIISIVADILLLLWVMRCIRSAQHHAHAIGIV